MGRRRSVPPPPGARKGSISASRPAPSDRAEIPWSGPHGRARARAIELLQPSALSRYRRCREEVPPPPLTLSPPPTGDEDFLQDIGSDFEPGAGAHCAKSAAGRRSVAWRHFMSRGGWSGVHFRSHFRPHSLVLRSLKVISGANPMPVTSRNRCAHVRSLCSCSVCSDFRVTVVSRAGPEASREPRVGLGARQRLCKP